MLPPLQINIAEGTISCSVCTALTMLRPPLDLKTWPEVLGAMLLNPQAFSLAASRHFNRCPWMQSCEDYENTMSLLDTTHEERRALLEAVRKHIECYPNRLTINNPY